MRHILRHSGRVSINCEHTITNSTEFLTHCDEFQGKVANRRQCYVNKFKWSYIYRILNRDE